MNTRRLGLVAAFVILALVWGSSFLFIKESLTAFTPAQVVLGRVVLGAVTLLLVMLVSGRKWPREPRFWGHMTVVGLLLCVAPFSLFAWAGESLPSGLSAILNAATPLMTALATAAVLPSERLRRGQSLGIVVGGAGVVLVIAPSSMAASQALLDTLPAQLACLGAAACYGLGFAYMRRFIVGRHHYDSITVATVQLTLAAAVALLAFPFAALAAPAGAPLELSPAAVISLVLLGSLGTGVAYILNTAIVTRWGAVRASTVTYLTPLVAVLLGVVLLDERLSWNQPVGCLVVITGIIAAHRSATAHRAARVPEPTTANGPAAADAATIHPAVGAGGSRL
ncbi:MULTISPECIES: DMT family transporter [Arthrobacter]|uniref:DMT family transporter n=2 Tax=Arthrobacter TaxID=1663 RepID=A0ABU9KME5_9MICC|nr:DMT family transporter [Arthrobacter sp. YJM1]MDP5228006.1 DMT family transporter [Arthrobacter sp. YJM1]